MSGIVAWLLAEAWPYIALVAAAFAAFLGIRQSGKAAGKAEMERDQAEAAAEQRGKINEADTLPTLNGDCLREQRNF